MRPRIRLDVLGLIGIVVLLNIVFLPPVMPRRFELREGQIARADVIAPYDFEIPKSTEELTMERTEISERVPPIYEMDREVPARVARSIRRLQTLLDSVSGQPGAVAAVQAEFPVPPPAVEYLLRSNHRNILQKLARGTSDVYARGVMGRVAGRQKIVTIIAGEKELIESVDNLYTLAQAESVLTEGSRSEYRIWVAHFLTPNVNYSESRTNERIDEVFANIPRVKGKVLKGEIVVEKHKRVSHEAIEKLAALEATYHSLGLWEVIRLLILRNLFYASLMYLVLRFEKITGTILTRGRNLLLVLLLSSVYLVIGKVALAAEALYVIPVSFFIFIFAVYFDFGVAFLFTVIYAAVFGVLLNSLPAFVFLSVSGLTAALSSQTVKSRWALYRPLLYIAVANLAAILFIAFYLTNTGLRLAELGAGVLNSVLAGLSIALLLPAFERFFDFTTDLTLLELGNLNLPLFKEMSIRAPGTYHHSIVTGNLAEAGANAIGADAILARVGAYFHDIGKMTKPEYFIENQIGLKNPHDDLKPQMSALLIISHVKEGVEMARRMRLPRRLIDIIAQHHGTTTIELFYRKALHLSQGLTQDAFSYPGPKPKTKEAALVMLADSVEATARSEKNITVAKLQRILKESFDRKFNDGQLDDCPINRSDLELVKTAFLPILTGVFHPRIEYDKSGSDNQPVAPA